ncbi:MAG: hypothetical protein IJ845_06565 [Bacteroidaceae bacterium]|nr:hypothetical protein [Bacteroidaceae bacterium]
MRTIYSYLFAALACFFLASCTNDLEVLIPTEENGENLLVKIDADYRSLKPSASGSSMETSTDHRGQKGRDHREGILNYNQAFRNYPDPSSLELGKLYPVSHDHLSGECVFMFYFGEIPVEDDILFYSDQLLFIELYDKDNELYWIYNHNSDLKQTGSQHYEVGDPIIIPSEFCERCASFRVRLWNKQDGEDFDFLSFIQPYASPHHWN